MELSPLLPDSVADQARAVLERAKRLGRSLATAESCTGGMLSSLLTDVRGLSGVFERGYVVYSDQAKSEMLGVDRACIDQWGAVSRQTAVAMAEGALRASRADLAISVTGYADDGPDPGLVHFACAATGRETIHREVSFGPVGRGAVRLGCMKMALTMIDEML